MLEAQAAYLTALENDDDEALRELAARFATPLQRAASRSAAGTPAGWETPSVAGTPRAHGGRAGGATGAAAATPSPFDTPGPAGSQRGKKARSAAVAAEDDEDDPAAKAAAAAIAAAESGVSLDQFLDKFTSEDNESFEKLMEKHREKLIRKHEWL